MPQTARYQEFLLMLIEQLYCFLSVKILSLACKQMPYI